MKIKFRSAIFPKIRRFNCFINEKISLISQAIKIISISHRKITVALLPASFLFPMSFPNRFPNFFFFFYYPTISHYSPRFYHYNYHFRCFVHTTVLYADTLILAFDLSFLFISFIFSTHLFGSARPQILAGKEKRPRRAHPSFPLRKNIEKRVVKG